jgi:hypothetical protein
VTNAPRRLNGDPLPSVGSGVNSLSTVSICGDGNASVSAAGTSAGNATAITFVYNNITTVTSGAGVKLPPTEMGELIWITNSGANALTVYPYEATSTINATSSAVINIGCAAAFFAVSNSAWEELQGFNGEVPILHYGAFSDTTTQTIVSINAAYGNDV